LGLELLQLVVLQLLQPLAAYKQGAAQGETQIRFKVARLAVTHPCMIQMQLHDKASLLLFEHH
jgi:hypothetical protein